MSSHLREMPTGELLILVQREAVTEGQAVDILRNPFCTPEIAERILENPSLAGSHRICALVCAVEGMPTGRVADLMALLPWSPLLQVVQTPRTPPAIKRLAERRLILRLSKMTLGERTAIARRTHRALFGALMESGDREVFLALLDNPRTTEADLISLLNSRPPTGQVVTAILRHRRWSKRPGVMAAVVRTGGVPLPLALSALAQLPLYDLQELSRDPRVPTRVRDEVRRLIAHRRPSRTK